MGNERIGDEEANTMYQNTKESLSIIMFYNKTKTLQARYFTHCLAFFRLNGNSGDLFFTKVSYKSLMPPSASGQSQEYLPRICVELGKVMQNFYPMLLGPPAFGHW
jgi:hypothetical protein